MSENLILASTSVYRARLLAQLGVPFNQTAPEYRETTIAQEPPDKRCLRLSEGKARSIELPPGTTVLGSDQVAHLEDGTVLHKPGGFERARVQLTRCSGQWVSFTTGICLVDSSGVLALDCETFRVRFRSLTDATIEAYLLRDQPYDSAGSIKAEGLGVTLLSETHGRDVHTLYGLPLMLLTDHFLRLKLL